MIESPTRSAGLVGLAEWVKGTFGVSARLQRQLEEIPGHPEDVLGAMRTRVREVMGLEGPRKLIIDGVDWQTHGARRTLAHSKHSRVTGVQIDKGQEIKPVRKSYWEIERRLRISYAPWRYKRDVTGSNPLNDSEVMRVWLETSTPENVSVGLFVKVGMDMFKQELQAAHPTIA